MTNTRTANASASSTTTTPAKRQATIERATRETSIRTTLNLDGAGASDIKTGIGFYDHLLTSLATHARFDLLLTCTGDLHIDDHHSVEDIAIVLGMAMDKALGARSGIRRFASAHAPMDESLARCAIDLVTRPFSVVNLDLRREMLGTLSCENIPHALATLAAHARFTMHIDVLRGDNDHHKAEAAFKALALALREAVAIDPSGLSVASTKGVM